MAKKSLSATTPTNGVSMASADASEGLRNRERTSEASPDTSPDQDLEFDWEDPRFTVEAAPVPNDSTLLPGGRRSLSSIGLQAFFLGFALAASLLLLSQFAFETPHPAWRLPAYFACLSIFHFLEYWTTARFNLPAVRASSFLLYSNGRAYNLANLFAVIEAVISSFVPSYRTFLKNEYTMAIGCVLVVVGQVVRSVAMSQAGTNFNHTPVKTKKDDHQLVTRGVYGWLRHPSYFGFFWWALGTQLLVGNKVCLLGYTVVLWMFFHYRIIGKILEHSRNVIELTFLQLKRRH